MRKERENMTAREGVKRANEGKNRGRGSESGWVAVEEGEGKTKRTH